MVSGFPCSTRIGAVLLVSLLGIAGAARSQGQAVRGSAPGDTVVTGVLAGTPRAATTIPVARVAVSTVAAPGVDAISLLAGRVAGAAVSSPSGRPGTVPDLALRGPTLISDFGRGHSPLFSMDGAILQGGIPAINPQDIEAIEVVRGTAAAAMYGARAANGVVNIITRTGRGASRGLTFRFRAEAGFSDIEREIQLARQHPLLLDASGTRFCVADPSLPLCARSVDWTAETDRVNNHPGDQAAVPAALALDAGSTTSGPALRQVFQSGLWPVATYDPVRQVAVSRPFVSNGADISGSVGGTRVFASVSALRQQGSIRLLDGFARRTARLNVDRSVGGALSLSLRAFYSRGSTDGVSQDGVSELLSRLSRQPASANLLARDSLGRLYARSTIMARGDENSNPLIAFAGVTDVLKSSRFVGAGSARWEATPSLSLEASLAFDRRRDSYEYLRPQGLRTQGPAWSSEGYRSRADGDGDGINAGLSLTLRHSLMRVVAVRWSLRWSHEREDASLFTTAQSLVPMVGGAGDTASQVTAALASTSSRITGLFGGVNLEYRQKLFADLFVRRDRSTLFGPDRRSAMFGRGSLAYRPSRESWWPWREAVNDLKLRASYSVAGARRSSTAQYDVYGIVYGIGGSLPASQQWSGDLRPETTGEAELGADLELFGRVGVNLTYSSSVTRDQILPATAPTDIGTPTQWQNAGTLANQTWEFSVDVPVVRKRDVSWTWRLNWDRGRSVITRLDVAPFTMGAPVQGAGGMYVVRQGERLGTIYGGHLLRGVGDCALLPAQWGADCGTATSAFQVNDDGFLVWVGGTAANGRTWRDGLEKNLWTAQLPAGSAPWGVALNWGMPIALRDSTGAHRTVPLGVGLPDWRFAVSQEFTYRRLSVHALLEGVMGREVWNYSRHWSYLDLNNRDVDQRGKAPETAKPIGYYYRSGPPESGAGIGGLYQTLAPYNHTVETASFAKLRELSFSYHVGRIGGVGDWDVSLIGRNLLTITKYKGYDPEVGLAGPVFAGDRYSHGSVDAIDAFTFPNTRTLTIAVTTSLR